MPSTASVTMASLGSLEAMAVQLTRSPSPLAEAVRTLDASDVKARRKDLVLLRYL